MSAVLGIDFGTTNTAAAWIDEQNKLQVVPVRESSSTLPSVVCFHGNGSVLVGDAAREFIVDDPKNTIFGVKRFLGRRFLSDFVGRHRARYVFQLVEGTDGLTAAMLHGRAVPLEEVAFHILSRMVELANIARGEPFQECVISVPAHYTYRQRQVIRRVAERLLTVKAMINEPTAAAMYYAKSGAVDENVLVYDLGGGTFDATVLRLRRGVVEVLATGGDAFLGGQDFDNKIVEHLAEGLLRDEGVDTTGDMIVTQRLTFAAEKAKIALSHQDSVHLRVPCLTMSEDRFVDLDVDLTRREMDAAVAPLIERTLGLSEQIVKRAGLSPSDLREVVLVGGQTHMPSIRRRLAQVFPLKDRPSVDPSLAVAVGAAVFGKGAHGLVDVLSVPIGVQVPGQAPAEAVSANVPLPCVRRVRLNARPPAGRPLVAVFYEAVEIASIDRDIIGNARVEPPWLDDNPGDLALEVRMSASFVLEAFLHASEGGRLPLEVTEVQVAKPNAPPKPSDSGVAVARGEPRVAVGGHVALRAGVAFQMALIVNLSRSGMLVETPNTWEVGTDLIADLDLDGERVSLAGQVVRLLGEEPDTQMALRFVDVPPSLQGVLDAFLAAKGARAEDLDEPFELDDVIMTPAEGSSVDPAARAAPGPFGGAPAAAPRPFVPPSSPAAPPAVAIGQPIEPAPVAMGQPASFTPGPTPLARAAPAPSPVTPPVGTPTPVGLTAPVPPPTDPAEQIRLFLNGVAHNRLYEALSLHPLSTAQQVQARLHQLHALFTKLMPRVSAPLQARLKTAVSVLERTGNLLSDPRRRLEYDFRCGHVMASERLAQAGADASAVALFRECWHRAHPERVDKAAIHIAYAMRQAKAGDVAKAAKGAEEALRLDPFNASLRNAYAQWSQGIAG